MNLCEQRCKKLKFLLARKSLKILANFFLLSFIFPSNFCLKFIGIHKDDDGIIHEKFSESTVVLPPSIKSCSIGLSDFCKHLFLTRKEFALGNLERLQYRWNECDLFSLEVDRELENLYGDYALEHSKEYRNENELKRIEYFYKYFDRRNFIDMNCFLRLMNIVSYDIKSTLQKENINPNKLNVGNSEGYKSSNIKSYVQKFNIKVGDKVIVVGDIHGSAHSLCRILLDLQFMGYLKNNFKLSPGIFLVFTGDLIGRGAYSLEVLFLILKLKAVNPDNVIWIKGNHEDFSMNKLDGFHLEMEHKGLTNEILPLYLLFNLLPLAAYGCCDNEEIIQFCHGGLPIFFREDVGEYCISECLLSNLNSFLKDSDSYFCCMDSPEEKLCNYFWGDFFDGYGVRKLRRGDDVYGVGIRDIENFFIEIPGLKYIFRGHQHNSSSVSFLHKGHWVEVPDHIEHNLCEMGARIFTCMSCPEGMGGPLGGYCNSDGFCILKKNNDRFSFKSFKRNLPICNDRDSKYVHISLNDETKMTYFWENKPQRESFASAVLNHCEANGKLFHGVNSDDLII